MNWEKLIHVAVDLDHLQGSPEPTTPAEETGLHFLQLFLNTDLAMIRMLDWEDR